MFFGIDDIYILRQSIWIR